MNLVAAPAGQSGAAGQFDGENGDKNPKNSGFVGIGGAKAPKPFPLIPCGSQGQKGWGGAWIVRGGFGDAGNRLDKKRARKRC